MTVTAVPVGARLVHIGPPKTGTTAVQKAMHHWRPQLAEQGVLYPGDDSRPREASRELLQPPSARTGAWQALVDEVRSATADRVCISSETFSVFDDDRAAELVEGLGGESVHIALTVRPVDALLPSAWQQHVRRALGTPPYEEWLRRVLLGSPGQRHFDRFWRIHDLADQLRRWTEVTSPERVTVIVSEEGNRSFLLHTFEDLLGLPRDFLVPRREVSNPSLPWLSGELLLRLDRVAEERGWDSSDYFDGLRTDLANHLRMLPRDPGERKALPEWAAERVYEVNTARADLLAAAAVRVVGDPDSLRPEARRIEVDTYPERPAVPADLAAEALAAAFESTRSALEEELRRTRRRADRLERQLAEGRPAAASVRRLAGRVRRAVRGGRPAT